MPSILVGLVSSIKFITYKKKKKDKCFWTIKKTSDCTWGWRTMLKLREYSRLFLKYEVGDGTKIFLWHDYWHPDEI